jgi:hypothetical protein
MEMESGRDWEGEARKREERTHQLSESLVNLGMRARSARTGRWWSPRDCRRKAQLSSTSQHTRSATMYSRALSRKPRLFSQKLMCLNVVSVIMVHACASENVGLYLRNRNRMLVFMRVRACVCAFVCICSLRHLRVLF